MWVITLASTCFFLNLFIYLIFHAKTKKGMQLASIFVYVC